MKLTICSRCQQRPARCTCATDRSYTGRPPYVDVEMETPAEVEARLHRLLDYIAQRRPSIAITCANAKARAMEISAPPSSDRRARPRDGARGSRLA